ARAYLACQILRLTFLATAAWIGSRWGLLGVCWAVIIGNLAYFFVAQFFITHFLKATLLQVLRNLLPPFALTLVMAAAESLGRLWVQEVLHVDPRISLIVTLLIGVVTYITAIHILPFKEVQEIYSDIMGQFRDKLRKLKKA